MPNDDAVQVVRRRSGRETVVFEGQAKDAVQFLSDNYPRIHVEPGSPDGGAPDALLKANGKYAAFHGPETGLVETDENGTPLDVDDDDNDDNDDNDDDDDNPPPVKKTTAAKKTAAKKTAAPAFGGTQ